MSEQKKIGWENLSAFTVDEDAEAELLEKQTECTLIWNNKDGHPIGAVVNFMFREGRFWFAATEARPRVAAMRADPRISVAISSKGSGIEARRSLTFKGIATVHDDAETKAWFLPELSRRLRPGDPERQKEFLDALDSDLRVVIELAPIGRTSYDGPKMWATRPGAGYSATDPTWSR